MDSKHWTWWPMTDWTHRREGQTHSVLECMCCPVRAHWTVWTCKNCAVASWVWGVEKRLSSVTSCIYLWTELLICSFHFLVGYNWTQTRWTESWLSGANWAPHKDAHLLVLLVFLALSTGLKCALRHVLRLLCVAQKRTAKQRKHVKLSRACSFQPRSRWHCGAFCILAGTSSLGTPLGNKTC